MAWHALRPPLKQQQQQTRSRQRLIGGPTFALPLSLPLQDNGVELAERMERASQLVKQVYSECPSYDVVSGVACVCV